MAFWTEYEENNDIKYKYLTKKLTKLAGKFLIMVFFYGRRHSCTRKKNGGEEKKLFFVAKKAVAGLFYINIY